MNKISRIDACELFLGIGIGILGNVAAEYLGEMAKNFEIFKQLSISYHLFGAVGTSAFFIIFFILFFFIRKNRALE